MIYLKTYESFSDNDNFKNWFKDSKVVDSDGNPLVVYHQTQGDFSIFDINRSYTHSFWFTSNLDKINKGETGATNLPGTESKVMKVYLSIQKMAGWDEYDKYGVGELISMGYDGIKLDDDYVVFEPNQIKSIDNRGSFNNDSDNIYESFSDKPMVLYHGTPNKFDKFSTSYFNTGSGDGGWLGRGIYFTNDYDYAESYGEVIKAEIDIKNPYILTDENYSRAPLRLIRELKVDNSTEVTQKLKNMGYDAVMLKYKETSNINDNEYFIEVNVFDVENINIIK